jgi:hAT family C-terminal dimerisation region
VFLPLLDGLLLHIRDRFGPTQEKALALGHLVPANIAKEFKVIEPALKIYGHFISSELEVRAEFEIWRHRWRDLDAAKKVNTAATALENCPLLTMPNIHALLQVLATLPVTTAEPERIFSKVEKTASCTRSIGEERLEALVLLQAHLEITPSVDEVMDTFAKRAARRLNFIL